VSKKKKQIDLAEVLEELKASVFALYLYEKVKVSSAAKKTVNEITAEEFRTALGDSLVKTWIEQNISFEISSHAEYVEWTVQNIYSKAESGDLEDYLKALPISKRKPLREFFRSWENVHKVFYTLIDSQSLKLIASAYEKRHFIQRGDALPRQPLLGESQDEVYNSLMDFSQRSPAVSLGATDKTKYRELLTSKVTYENWLNVLTILAKSDFLDKSYAVNVRFLRTWLANHIAFDRAHQIVPVTQETVKLEWTGPATALAEWLLLVRNHLTDYSHVSNKNLLKWVDQSIVYPGTKAALIAAISAVKGNNTKFFTLKHDSPVFEFSVHYSARMRKKSKH
jgi:hypothetical protein